MSRFQEEEDRIIKIISDTFDRYAMIQAQNIELKARIVELEEELAGRRKKESTLHAMRVEQGAL